MIETCPKKRMILAISCLVLLTILVLVIESNWTESPRQKQFIIEDNSTCWRREDYTIIQDCHPCTAFEIASKSQGVCVHTNNKEVLRCKSGETVSRSCDKVAWLDERNYWKFQLILFLIGSASTFVSFMRQRFLDRQTTLKIQRQLGHTV
ncbi:Protein JTB [Pseudolycoriella hygida]|uniref:Protein JTB n=1 Tax=Pseudolycoriella hygida TaxID=35572 RepID=A0A9Q0N3C4_9DIPT|nr:Protein JTB [Pseudolycoriella hygida]